MVLVSEMKTHCRSFSIAVGSRTAVLSDSLSISITSTTCDIAELPSQCVTKINKTSRIYHNSILLIGGTFFTTAFNKNVVIDLVVYYKE